MQLEYGKHCWFSGKDMWQYAGNLGSILGSVKASKEYFSLILLFVARLLITIFWLC